MANSREDLLRRLALANKARAVKKKQVDAEKPQVTIKEHPPAPVADVPADGQRELAKATAVDAMVMGWSRAIQKHAYEASIPESELRKVLDAALEYNDKADPSGRIQELEDWRHEKRGTSTLAPKRR